MWPSRVSDSSRAFVGDRGMNTWQASRGFGCQQLSGSHLKTARFRMSCDDLYNELTVYGPTSGRSKRPTRQQLTVRTNPAN